MEGRVFLTQRTKIYGIRPLASRLMERKPIFILKKSTSLQSTTILYRHQLTTNEFSQIPQLKAVEAFEVKTHVEIAGC